MKKINRQEFCAISQTLFGTKWKTAMTIALGLSPNSRSVARIISFEMNVSDAISSKTVQVLQNKLQQLELTSMDDTKSKQLAEDIHSMLDYLENPSVITLDYASGKSVRFDLDGVATIEQGNVSPPRGVSYTIPNAELKMDVCNIPLQNFAIKIASQEAALLGDPKSFKQFVKGYFKMGAVPQTLF